MKNKISKVEILRRKKISKAHRGKIISKETREKLRLVNIGKKHSEETKRKISISNLGGNSGSFYKGMKQPHNEKNQNWKGDDIGYSGIHKWLSRNFPKPSQCEFCNKKKRIYWANREKIYKRLRENYIPLCASCHIFCDKNKLWEVLNKNGN